MLKIKDGKMSITGRKDVLIEDIVVFYRLMYSLLYTEWGWSEKEIDTFHTRLRACARASWLDEKYPDKVHHVPVGIEYRLTSSGVIFLTPEEKRGEKLNRKEVKKNVRKKKNPL